MKRRLLLLALSNALGMGCQPKDTGVTSEDSPAGDSDTAGATRHTGETNDTAPPDASDYWDGFEWTGLSDLDIIMDHDQAPQQMHWQVRICESAEWWGKGCEEYTTLAHAFSSLDGVLTEDGFILLGIPDGNMWHGSDLEVDLSNVHFLSTPDLEHWGSHIEPLDGIEDTWAIDPAIVLEEDGQPSFVYYDMPLDCADDPLTCPGDHDIKRAHWDGAAFTVQEEPIFSYESLVDPTVFAFDDGYYLFTTCGSDVCHAMGEDATNFELTDDYLWSGVQVPHANSYEGDLMVVGQGGGGWPPPRYVVLNEDGAFPDEDEQLWSDHENLSFFGGSCTSPVLVYFNATYYTICAVLADRE